MTPDITSRGLFLTLAIHAFGVQALTPGQVFIKAKDSVVVVKALDAKGRTIAQGSGVLLPSGKIGTNCHVVKNSERFQVGGGKQFVPANLWGSDEGKDICLLEARGLTAKPAQLGQATRLNVGDPVYAVGAPRGLELSLSNGIVSQLRGGPPPFIQTTAAISPGSSGGGLFDAEGRLVGFTTLHIEGGQNLNFAMPVEWAGEIQAGKKVARGRSEVDWILRVAALEVTENWTGIRDWCQQWTRTQSENGTAWICLGMAYNKLQRYVDAIEALREALRINPQIAGTWTSIAHAYGSLQRYPEAVDAFRQALRINPRDALAWFGLGIAYNTLQRHTEAVEALRESLRINPQHDGAWRTLGYAYTLLQRYAEAIDAFRESLRINSRDALTWKGLALSYAGSGNRTAALEAVQQLRHLDPAEADRMFNLIVPR